jgi:hypothetical protein
VLLVAAAGGACLHVIGLAPALLGISDTPPPVHAQRVEAIAETGIASLSFSRARRAGHPLRLASSGRSARIGLLTGKVVFITGASRGGAAAARLFAEEGAAVVLAARSAGALDRAVTEVRVVELHGRLDGAFNNGAEFRQQPGPLDTTSDEDIDGQFAVNFRVQWTAMTAGAAQPDESINRSREWQRRAGAGPSIRRAAWPIWAAHLRKGSL